MYVIDIWRSIIIAMKKIIGLTDCHDC